MERYAWSVWEHEIAKALPEYQIVDIPLAHPLFHMLYQVNAVPQIPSINYWFGSGGQTSERVDSRTARMAQLRRPASPMPPCRICAELMRVQRLEPSVRFQFGMSRTKLGKIPAQRFRGGPK